MTYKANGQNAQTVTLDKGLNFVNGKNTTASVDGEGVVKYDVNKDLVNINSHFQYYKWSKNGIWS